MTKEEMLNIITSTPKWYLGVFKQQTASAMLKRIKNGNISINNFNKFLDKMGYKEVSSAEYEIEIFNPLKK